MVPDLYIENPLAVYDTEKKQLIGIFSSLRNTAKYLHGHNYALKENIMRSALRRKSKFKVSTVSCMVTLRIANKIQLEKLQDNHYVLNDGYPRIPEGISFKEFDSGRLKMKEEMIDNNNKRKNATTSKT